VKVLQLSWEEARRIAIRAQLLDGDRPKDLLEVADRLTFLQLDPTAVVAPAADLVAWTRLGPTYSPAHLEQALEQDRTMFEHRDQPSKVEPALALLRPIADIGLHLPGMIALRSTDGQVRTWLEANAGFRQRVLDQLADSGPLSSREIPDTCEVPWASTGWTNDRNVTQMLQFLGSRGFVAVAGRRGRQRLWDLAERIYPTDIEAIPADEARRILDERRLRSLGVCRPKLVGSAGVPAEIEGTAGEWRLDPEATADGFEGRTALLSPFDRLSHDRARAVELFGFEYTLEMYKPKDKRRWGYFALPILHGEELVGKIDATADRKTGCLQVHAVHEDVPFTPPIKDAVQAELTTLAKWLRLDTVHLP